LIEQNVRKVASAGSIPVRLEDIKLDLRVDSDDENDTIRRMALGAAAFLEKRTGYVLVPGSYELTMGEWFCDPFEVYKAPFRALERVECLTAVDTWSEMDLSNFRVSVREKSFLIIPAAAFIRPALFEDFDSIRVAFTAGADVVEPGSGDPNPSSGLNSGDGDFALDDGIRTLFLMTVAHYYKNRELFLADKEAEIIERAGSLLGAYRTYY